MREKADMWVQMKSYLYPLQLSAMIACSVSFSMAQPEGEERKPEVIQQALGYWIIDFDSEATKAILKKQSELAGAESAIEALNDIKTQMAATTFELTATELVNHSDDYVQRSGIAVTAQDHDKKTFQCNLTLPDAPPQITTFALDGDKLTVLNGNARRGKDQLWAETHRSEDL